MNLVPELFGASVHPASFAEARLLDVREHATKASGVEAQRTAGRRGLRADIDAVASDLAGSKVKDGSTPSERLALVGLGVGVVEQGGHRGM